MNELNVRGLMNELRAGAYTSVGSYPRFFVTAAGETLSFAAVREAIWDVARAVRDEERWSGSPRVIAADVNWERTDLICALSGEPIESAYGDAV